MLSNVWIYFLLNQDGFFWFANSIDPIFWLFLYTIHQVFSWRGFDVKIIEVRYILPKLYVLVSTSAACATWCPTYACSNRRCLRNTAVFNVYGWFRGMGILPIFLKVMFLLKALGDSDYMWNRKCTLKIVYLLILNCTLVPSFATEHVNPLLLQEIPLYIVFLWTSPALYLETSWIPMVVHSHT